MKKIAFFLIFLSNFSFSQNNKASGTDNAYIDTINTNGELFFGSIDKYAISCYLEIANYYDGDNYSLTGWYQYENKKIPIPLVGFYSQGEITLYHFTDKKRADSVLNIVYNEEKMDFWEGMSSFLNKEGFNEKFRFIYEEGYKGIWTNGKKELESSLFYDFPEITTNHEFLQLKIGDLKRTFELKKQFNHDGFVVESSLIKNGTLKVLLSYSCPSRGRYTVTGSCGGGTDDGFAVIEMNDKGQLITANYFPVNVCLENQYTTEENPQKVNDILTLTIQDDNFDDKPINKTLKVNFKTVEITEKILTE